MSRKPEQTTEKPPPHTDEAESDDRRPSSTGRPRPPEPFEECGPTGGYGGAGTDEADGED
jgi:hypothetical protein